MRVFKRPSYECGECGRDYIGTMIGPFLYGWYLLYIHDYPGFPLYPCKNNGHRFMVNPELLMENM